MKKNKGFSLVELIIVVAVIAILVGLIAPMYMQYVRKTKRTVDAKHAEEMIRAMDVAAVYNDATSYSSGSGAWLAKAYYATTIIDDDSIYSRAFRDLGGVPKSKYDEELWWFVYYFDPLSDPTGVASNLSQKPVKKIYLVYPPDFTKGYEVYPNPGKYIEKEEMVPITYD